MRKKVKQRQNFQRKLAKVYQLNFEISYNVVCFAEVSANPFSVKFWKRPKTGQMAKSFYFWQTVSKNAKWQPWCCEPNANRVDLECSTLLATYVNHWSFRFARNVICCYKNSQFDEDCHFQTINMSLYWSFHRQVDNNKLFLDFHLPAMNRQQ